MSDATNTRDTVRGFSFPFRIDARSGRVAVSEEDDKIRENVKLILTTRLGERPMLRDFGSRIPELVHEPNNSVLADLIQDQARQAITRWESRAVVTDLDVVQFEGELTLRVTYVRMDQPSQQTLLVPVL